MIPVTCAFCVSGMVLSRSRVRSRVLTWKNRGFVLLGRCRGVDARDP